MKSVIVTVDTEGHVGADPIRHLVYGATENGRYGVEYIMDIFDEVHAKVLFFVDFAEAWDYGHDKIERVVRTIIERGHDVGVHIHPDHMADKQRAFLWQYSHEEQFEIIKKCTELYTEIVGRRPLSFRAGKYGANRDTLDILCELGYKYDFSQFYHQKWCGIKPAITINSPVRYKNLVEFPVTMHRSLKLLGYSRYDKVDIESMIPGELRYALDQITKQNFPVVVTLFLHSFSLMEWAAHPDNPARSDEKINKLEEAIKSVSEKRELEYICEADLADITPVSENEAKNSMISWKSTIKGVYFSYQKLKFIARRNNRAKLLLAAGWITLGLVLLVILVLLFK